MVEGAQGGVESARNGTPSVLWALYEHLHGLASPCCSMISVFRCCCCCCLPTKQILSNWWRSCSTFLHKWVPLEALAPQWLITHLLHLVLKTKLRVFSTGPRLWHSLLALQFGFTAWVTLERPSGPWPSLTFSSNRIRCKWIGQFRKVTYTQLSNIRMDPINLFDAWFSSGSTILPSLPSMILGDMMTGHNSNCIMSTWPRTGVCTLRYQDLLSPCTALEWKHRIQDAWHVL